MSFPYTQIRIARPTASLQEVLAFYKEGMGLSEIGGFQDHAGYSGVMLGLPDAQYHLEFTQYADGLPCPPPGKDNLLVFYLPNAAARDEIVQRLAKMGYAAVPAENPYWNAHGITIEDPDGWRIVLMDVPGFKGAV
jgi:catechol 2,3-dioxygenase-like lactoylglutathione lyase family enzyme